MPMVMTSFEPTFLMTPWPITLTSSLQLTWTSMAFVKISTNICTRPKLLKDPITDTLVTVLNHSPFLGCLLSHIACPDSTKTTDLTVIPTD
jgi:hypothetical protein